MIEHRLLYFTEVPGTPQAHNVDALQLDMPESPHAQLIALQAEVQESLPKREEISDIVAAIEGSTFQGRREARSRLTNWLHVSLLQHDVQSTLKTLEGYGAKSAELRASIDASMNTIDASVWQQALAKKNDVEATQAALDFFARTKNEQCLLAVTSGASASDAIFTKVFAPMLTQVPKPKNLATLAIGMAHGNIHAFAAALEQAEQQDVINAEQYVDSFGNAILPEIARGLDNRFLRRLYQGSERESERNSLLPHVLHTIGAQHETQRVKLGAAVFLLDFTTVPLLFDDEYSESPYKQIEEAGKLLNQVLLENRDANMVKDIAARAADSVVCWYMRPGLLHVAKDGDKFVRIGALEALARIGELGPVADAWEQKTFSYQTTNRYIDDFFRDALASVQNPDHAESHAQVQLTRISLETVQRLRKSIATEMAVAEDLGRKTDLAFRIIQLTHDQESAAQIATDLVNRFRKTEAFPQMFEKITEMERRLGICSADAHPREFDQLLQDNRDASSIIIRAHFQDSTLPQWKDILERIITERQHDDNTIATCAGLLPLRSPRQYALLENLIFEGRQPDVISRAAIKRLLTEYTGKSDGKQLMDAFFTRCFASENTFLRSECCSHILRAREVMPGMSSWFLLALRDESVAVQKNVVEALQSSGHNAYKRLLLHALVSQHAEIRTAIDVQLPAFESAEDFADVLPYLTQPKKRSFELLHTLLNAVLEQKFMTLVDPLLAVRKGECTPQEAALLDEGFELAMKECPRHDGLLEYMQNNARQP